MSGAESNSGKLNWALVALVVVLLAIPGCGIGCIGMASVAYVASQAVQVTSPDAPVAEEQQYWSALADFIQEHPERFEDTDRVYRIGQELQSLGKVSSVDRLSAYKAQMQTITEANRGQVISAVRGQR